MLNPSLGLSIKSNYPYRSWSYPLCFAYSHIMLVASWAVMTSLNLSQCKLRVGDIRALRRYDRIISAPHCNPPLTSRFECDPLPLLPFSNPSTDSLFVWALLVKLGSPFGFISSADVLQGGKIVSDSIFLPSERIAKVLS
jgi:hypothetical protein